MQQMAPLCACLFFLVMVAPALSRHAIRGASNMSLQAGCEPSDGLTICECCNYRQEAWQAGACHRGDVSTPCTECCTPPGPKFTPELYWAHRDGINDWGEVTCPGGYQVLGGGCDSGSPHHVTQYNGPVGDNQWRCGGHSTTKSAWAVCGKLKDLVIHKVGRVGDWGSVYCDNGYVAIGGGCNVLGDNYRFQASHPDGQYGWLCGGQGADKEVHVLCASPSSVEGLEIAHVSGGDWLLSPCPANALAIGGGCKANGPPHTFAKNWPDTHNQWGCGGNGGSKEVWAICLSGAKENN